MYDCFRMPLKPLHCFFSRPWTVIEKQVGLKNIKASIGTLVPGSEVAYTSFFLPLSQQRII